MKRIQHMIITKFAGIIVAVFIAGHVTAQTTDKQDIEAAKQEYEQAVPPGNEKARLTYVTKLAQIADRLVSEYRRGQRNDEAMSATDSELQKHPAPRDIDSKKLAQLLVGEWESPRRTYIFRRDGKYGMEGGSLDGHWRIQGNQIVGTMPQPCTIILLNSDYFIYTYKDGVLFHSRVKE